MLSEKDIVLMNIRHYTGADDEQLEELERKVEVYQGIISHSANDFLKMAEAEIMQVFNVFEILKKARE